MEHAQDGQPRKPIMVRADLTEEEWREIRQEAIGRDSTTSRYVGELIRAGKESLKTKEKA